MLIGIDHVILASRDPDADVARLEASLRLQGSGGGRHDAHGTFNRIVWLGDSYLELMGVFDEQLAEQSWWGRWIAAKLRTSPTAYAGLALASDDIVADAGELRERGSPISEPVSGERLRPDGDVVRWRMARLPDRDPELGLLFMIEHDVEAAEWRAADRLARAGGPRLLRVELPVVDPGRVSLRLVRELGLQFRPSLSGGGARDSSVGSQVVRLMRGDQPLIALRGTALGRETELLGVRWEAASR